MTLRTPETGDSFRLMIFGMVSDGAQQRTAARRTEHLHRLAAALNNDGSLAFDECADLAWASSHPVTADLRQGGPRPDEGWIAPSLGVRVPAPRLRLRGEFTTGRMVVLSVLVNRTTTSAWRVFPYHGETSGCLALQVEGADVRDLVIAGTASKAAVGGVFETDALVAVHRERPGGNPELHHVGGSYVRSIRSGAGDRSQAIPSREDPR